MTIIALILLLLVLVLAIRLLIERRDYKLLAREYRAIGQGMDEIQDCYEQDTLQYLEHLDILTKANRKLHEAIEEMEEPYIFHQEFCLPQAPKSG